MTLKTASFVRELARVKTNSPLFNPYSNLCRLYDSNIAPGVRQKNLQLYLDTISNTDHKTLWLFNHPNYRESKRSGVPLVNANNFREVEDIIGTKRRFDKATKTKKTPNNSRTSSILWGIIKELEHTPLIWFVLPFQPHKKGKPMSDRKPTFQEIHEHEYFVRKVIELYEPNHILAIGLDTQENLRNLNIKAISITHPAHTGKKPFLKAVSRYS